jgi:protocatechuate 3,4-dioxygenase beta subunit
MTLDHSGLDHDGHDDFGGLARDLPGLLPRRRMLALLAGTGLIALTACGSDSSSTAADTSGASATTGSGSTTTTAATAGTDAASATTAASTAATDTTTAATDAAAAAEVECTTIPGETAGPYPGDGSNGPNVLSESGVVRSDITTSIGSASGVAEGAPLSISLTLVDTSSDCAPLAGAAVYAWHCSREGLYSMYSNGAQDENYLRGVQEADANGKVTFQSIFPGAYSGRWPHIHFEIYPSLDAATSASGILATSQIALPEDACNLVYATDGYEQSVTNMTQTSLESDNVFGDDGAVRQLGTVTGDVASGIAVSLTVPV